MAKIVVTVVSSKFKSLLSNIQCLFRLSEISRDMLLKERSLVKAGSTDRDNEDIHLCTPQNREVNLYY